MLPRQLSTLQAATMEAAVETSSFQTYVSCATGAKSGRVCCA